MPRREVQEAVVTNLKALEIWTAQTICDVGILLVVVTGLLHAGRSYFERVLGRLTLRVAADLWWLAYVVMRDGSLAVAFLCGLWVLNLDLMADIKIAVPFVPLATAALALALAVKVLEPSDEAGWAKRTVDASVALAVALDLFGWVFVMEGPGSEYQAAGRPFWAALRRCRSNENPELSIRSFGTAGALLLIVVGASVVRWMRGRRRSNAKLEELRAA
jgi:hypothetical protein